MIELTYGNVLMYAQGAIQERGEDFVYQWHDGSMYDGPRCKYFHDGQPDCVVGVILHKAGVTVDESMNKMGSAIGALGSLKARGDITYTPEVQRFLQVIQARQDIGMTWGASYRIATHSVRSEFGDN